MTGPLVTAEDQIEVLDRLAEAFSERDLEVLALGSAALVLKTDRRGTTTKDVDVHAHPVEDIVEFQDVIDAASRELDGQMQWEPDGSSITLHVPLEGKDVPVEVILGREDFIEPEVLEDAARTATRENGVLVPSFEHLVAMKAEAWFDRTGEEQRRFLADLTELAEELARLEIGLDREEVHRIVEMRPERKRREMLRSIERVFEDRLE